MLSLVTPPTGHALTTGEAKAQLLQNASVGEPAPTAPTVTLVSAVGLITAGVHRWLWVFRTADGHTEAGEVSAPLTTILATAGQATVTKPIGGSAVTYCDLYRTAANGSTYLLVAASQANDGLAYTDNIADTSLGVEAPSTNTTEDLEIIRWIDSAESKGQRISRRQFRTATYDLVRTGFPSCGYIELPKPPLQSVTSVKYLDTAGVLQTWAASNYVVEAPAGDFAAHGTISLAYGITWPSTYAQAGSVQIRFVAGYGAASAVPSLLKDGMLIAVADRSAQRESVVIGMSMNKIPGTAEDIFKAFRVWPSQPRETAYWSTPALSEQGVG